MKEKLEALLRDGIQRVNEAKTEAELQEVKGSLLGKQGSVTLLMKEMSKLPKEERPAFGKIVNEFKQTMEEQFEARAEVVRKMEMDKKYKKTGCPNGQPVFVCVFYVLVLCRASGHRTDISPEQ